MLKEYLHICHDLGFGIMVLKVVSEVGSGIFTQWERNGDTESISLYMGIPLLGNSACRSNEISQSVHIEFLQVKTISDRI
jgi:hypothetical protein